MIRAVLCALGLGLAVSGCMTPKVTPGPMTNVAADPFPPPDAVETVARADYRIAPGDEISVSVFRVQELARTGQVAGDGSFFMPQIGDVPVAGKTSEEAAAAIAAVLGPNYVIDPQVTVSVKSSSVPQYTIGGSVNSPGKYDATENLTLLQAMAVAKGVATTGASVRQVVVFRVIGGQKTANIYDLAAIRAAKAVDPKIYPNDLIDVPSDNRVDTLRTIIGSVPLFSLFLH